MDNFFQGLGLTIVGFLPSLLAAILILVVGWLVAYLLSRLTENLLRRTNLDDRLAGMLQGGEPNRLPIERWISKAVFWVIMLFVIVAFLNTLNLAGVSGPLNTLLTEVLAFLPGLVGAALLLLLAFVIATVLRMLITRLVSASGLSRRLSESAEMDVDARGRMQIGETIGNVVFWLVFLLFLPAVLDALNLQGILQPVQAMVDDILGFLPNLLGAALVLAIGYLVARIIRQIVTNLLAGVGIDRIGARTDVPEADRFRLSNLIGTIVFVLILIPVVIAALNVLDIPAISGPASSMLTNFLNALPNIFAAALLIGVAYFVARIVGNFIAGLLASVGFDRMFAFLGFQAPPPQVVTPTTVEGMAREGGAEIESGRWTPSKIAGVLVTIAIILFAVMEGASLLGFDALSVLIAEFVVVAANILFGLAIFAIGLFLANQAERVIRNSNNQNAGMLATAARIAILIFSAALALREMGIASSIVNLAFGLLLGAIAVAVALAFGLGGREVAARQLERWQSDMRSGGLIPPTGGTPTGGTPTGGTPTGGMTPGGYDRTNDLTGDDSDLLPP